jgi:hypothetical protein
MNTGQWGWIGVDLDGTLAHYEGWNKGKIGAPIQPMVDRVKKWRSEGREVRIFTARVTDNGRDLEAIRADIEQWCYEHIGEVLPITNIKDFAMIELWDDRAVRVQANTGEPCCKFWNHVS